MGLETKIKNMFSWDLKKRIFMENRAYLLDTYNLNLKLEKEFRKNFDKVELVNGIKNQNKN